ncbi:PhnD/SsuA/transferrin family substrate-binding protein [Desulfobacter curvatus]|uniref:PhnD/SsuA/transferrin family substrate-binding protein n=1 Tax=Desulfobacter curvatus TaxID=2290 RepID=UPI0003626201|nr:PhnD/SsuA/transferrin family substrate-binding protein [Desulfobacter curvatus]
MQRNDAIKPVRFKRWIIALLVSAVCLQAGMAQSNERLNIGFSRSIIGAVNENDAMAVIKVWATELMVSANLLVNVQPQIYGDVREMETALKENRTDFLCFTIMEFVDLQHLLYQEKFIFPVLGQSMTEEYLLIARNNSSIAQIKDLKGCSLIYPKNPRTVLSVIWLDVTLARAGLSAAAYFFSRMVPVGKVNEALLPVFFGKEDACLVTRKSFDIMAELNPQISRQLKIVGTSQRYIPNFLAFRKNYQSKIREIILNQIDTWDNTPGRIPIFPV